MKKDFLKFFAICAFGFGALGGFGYAAYSGAWFIAFCIVILAILAWPTVKGYHRALRGGR